MATTHTMQAPLQTGASWHDPLQDQPLRAQLTQNIVQIFAKKKGQNLQQGWSSKIADFVRRLENELYSRARSREEYVNPETLEHRLMLVAKSLNRNGLSQPAHAQQQQQQQQQAMGQAQGLGQMAGDSQALQYSQAPGQGPNPGPAGVSGFVPTPGAGYGMDGGPGMAPVAGSPAVLEGGMVPTSITNPGVLPSGAPVLLRGQRDTSFGGGQSMPAGNGAGTRGSMNGMHPSMGGPSGHQQPGFVPNPGASYQPGGMVPVNATGGLPPPMQPPQTSGMIPNSALQGPGVQMPGMGMGPGPGGMPMGQFGGMQQQGPGGPPVPPMPPMPNNGAGGAQGPGGAGDGAMSEQSQQHRQHYVQKQQRWLLFLRHCAKCKQSETECQLQQQCKFGKQLWSHILNCAENNCEYPRCSSSKELLKHHQKCQSPQCPICAPVKEYVRKTRQQSQQQQQQAGGHVQQQQGPGVPSQPQTPQIPGMGGPGQPGQAQSSISSQQGLPGGMIPNPGSGMMPNPPGMIPNPPGMVPNPGMGPQGNSMGPGGGMMPNGMGPPPMMGAPGNGMMPNPGMMGGMNGMGGGGMGGNGMMGGPGGMPTSQGMAPGMMPAPGMGGGMMPNPGMGPGGMMGSHPGMGPGGSSMMGGPGGMGPGGMLPTNAMGAGPGMYPGASHMGGPGGPNMGNLKRSHSMMNGAYGPPGSMGGPMPGMMPTGPGGMPGPGGYMGAPGQPEQPMPKRTRATDEPVISKNTGTSLLETFSIEEIQRHKDSIYAAQNQQRQVQAPPANQSDACSVCGCTRLLYEPPVLYCTMCALKIKRGQTYYATPNTQDKNELRGCWCHQCFTEAKERLTIPGADGPGVRKTDLIKRKNDEEIEEPWVQCDNCEAWVHQICGLFNKGRNNTETHYLCPTCLIDGLRTNQRHRIENRPQSMLEAKDLPHCNLSRYLEKRLKYSLDQERRTRAAKEGKHESMVQTAEGLTIRVVNNVIKKCEVKPRFHETFGPEGYPGEFPYRQRVVVLFQNIEGVDVCLFVMYVQEYGEDSAPPNQNCVYLSYLDSVKYFRPELNAVPPAGSGGTNVALRTFVYHQILIGYVAYIKALGYMQMYIWACPPMQGDDYILYCHPNKQKTPRSDRLRNWYLDMLRQAREEGIVTHLSTLWDTFFPGGRDHRMERCSCTQIPYLEGDYWPGEAENQLATLADKDRQANKNALKGAGGGAAAAARKGAKGKRYGSTHETTDEGLMTKLGEILGGNMREDFIVVHMQEVCTFCRIHVLGGQTIYRYKTTKGQAIKSAPGRQFEGIKLEGGPSIPNAPITSLSLCEKCYQQEMICHTGGGTGKSLLPQNVTPADLIPEKLEMPDPPKQKDVDPDIDSEFFETRQSFLSLCQGNHYQFDTLRRAKHSSMMVLYHIHNPNAPAFASTCNVCNCELEAGAGYRCTVCADFDICANCKAQHGHPHPVVAQVNRKFDETQARLTEQERRERSEQMAKTMALLVHACSCNNPQCTSNSCRKVRMLFQHAVACQLKVTGGCQMCKKMWALLNLHAKSCARSDCPVPRCRELKDLRRRQTARQEEKRRHAYAAMLRAQQSQIASGSGVL